MPCDIRIITCDRCGGDRGWEGHPYGYDHINGNPLTRWIECGCCDDRGEVEIEVEPVERDDDLCQRP